jgi:hypothetical protein
LNPSVFNADYSKTAEYQQLCSQLRDKLEASV